MRVLAAALAALAVAPAAAQAAPGIQAHRGGPYRDGVPRYGENTLSAFRAAVQEGFVAELDVKRTADGVPVVIHDATLDRTTSCTGPVAALTAAQLRERCVVDLLGVPGTGPTAPSSGEPVPTLREVVDLLRDLGARANVEIKNLPTDGDFDTSDRYARSVLDVLDASGLTRGQVLVQSFWPPNLQVARARGWRTSLLTLAASNQGGPTAAARAGDAWVSPGWPVDAAYVARAHAEGLQVVPYTLDRAEDLRAAAEAHVDEVITNDPGRAARLLVPSRPAIPAAPSRETCARTRADRTLPTVEAYGSRAGGLRVFAMQVKQDVRHVVTHEAFRAKIECLIIDEVVPRLARDAPDVVAFDEDIGLATVATGSRGRVARERFAGKDAPGCTAAPCGAVSALSAIGAAYARERSAYGARFGRPEVLADTFLAATDTFARGWMRTFSDMARRYGVYVLGSNNQAPFRESTDPSEIELFADPDAPRPRSVFVATQPEVLNEVFVWGPQDVRRDGPAPLRNVVAQNKKVPLTSIEVALGIKPGPSTGVEGRSNLRPFDVPGTLARLGIATSLPAFTFGPPAPDPCADTSRTYMRCLDALGANVVVQDEANPGAWATYTAADSPDRGAWQPLSWMSSVWRQVTDPAVQFQYNVTPHLVGNLADLPFDGQSVVTQRGLAGSAGCHFVGTAAPVPGKDPERVAIGGEDQPLAPFAGPKREFVAILPWVRPDGPRDGLEATSRALGPDGDGDLENDYAEGVIAADLAFPPDPARAGCVQAGEATLRLRVKTAPAAVRRARATTVRVRVAGDGRPVRGARVRIGGRAARTDARGLARVRVRLVGRPGPRRVRASAPGFRPGETTLRVRRR